MLGEDGDRNYLLVFQNNAEVRATGGLPGAVSVIQARDGRIRLTKQVAANSFGRTEEPVLPLSPAEEAIYDTQLGTYFLDANFTPDFPRTADLMRARWEQVHEEKLDGIVSMDVLAVSYILRATGPVEVEDRTLTAQNVVDELLHEVYLRFDDPARQDVFFRNVARTVFDRVSTGIQEPEELAGALSEAASEGRLLFHSFRPPVQEVLAGTQIAGELATEAGSAPQVGIYLNDGTGSKMSYYLRYTADVEARSCQDNRQQLSGTTTLRQSIDPAVARDLPDYVTGGGAFGTEAGSQFLFLRLHAPYGGTVEEVRLDGKVLRMKPLTMGGRPVATFVVLLSSEKPSVLTWTMQTGPGQTGDVELGMTPSVVPGDNDTVVDNAC